jgi:O-antigen/teichoic acid export membrane protein
MMLGALLSPAATGAFNVAVRIMGLVEIPTNTMAVMVFPQSAKRMATGGQDAIKYLYEKSVGTVLALVVPCFLFLVLFPGFVVHIIAGNKYPETIPIIKVTVLYCFFIPYSRQFGTILDFR